MEKTTIALIVSGIIIFILVIITIVILSIYLSQGSTKSRELPKPRKVATPPLNSYKEEEEQEQQPSFRKIIKSPSTKRKVKLTPRNPSGKSDKLFVIDEDGSKHRLIPSITEPVIDIAPYNDGLLIILNYGNMIFLNKEDTNFVEYQLPGTIDIISIEPLN